MASEKSENEPAMSSPVPIRSILKKVSSDGVVNDSKPWLKKTGKTISFDASVTLQWEQEDSQLKEAGNGEVGGAVGVASNGETSLFSSSVEVRDSLGVAGSESTKHGKSSKLKSAFRSKVLRRSSRNQVQGGVADLDTSGSGFDADRRGDRAAKRFSEISASAEYPAAKAPSYPRTGSLDSADLFTRSNKSLRSRFVKFGRHFRPDSYRESDAALPVLTKITPLGGLCRGESCTDGLIKMLSKMGLQKLMEAL